MQRYFDPTNKTNIRLESVRLAAMVASPHDGIANLLIHAAWVADYILDGKSPALGTVAETPSP